MLSDKLYSRIGKIPTRAAARGVSVSSKSVLNKINSELAKAEQDRLFLRDQANLQQKRIALAGLKQQFKIDTQKSNIQQNRLKTILGGVPRIIAPLTRI